MKLSPVSRTTSLKAGFRRSPPRKRFAAALEKAFDYRGDVTITLKNETQVEGYIFDRQNGRTLADSRVRVLPKNGDAKIAIPYSEIQALAFSGRDTAAGKGWEAWLRKYWEKKAAGEQHIQREPEALE